MTTHPSHRFTSDLLRLWALCGHQACRRSKACKRDARACLGRFGPLAPEDARCGALALLQGAQDGVGIDEVRRFVPRDIAALEAWTATLTASTVGQARETCDHADVVGSQT
jgi:hypothetical protein